MNRFLLAGIVCGVLPTMASPVLADDTPGADELIRQIREVASTYKSVEYSTIGKTRMGNPIPLLTFTPLGSGVPSAQPALLIVAGVDGRHTVGVQTAIGVARALANDAGESQSLANKTIYIVPILSADAVDFAQSFPGVTKGRTPTPVDADHDGRIDEDRPADINHDGVITMMRIKDPSADSGLTATHMIDEDDPRIMVKPDAKKDQIATHAIIVEGIDVDGDGLIAEDARGGIDLNKNFPSLWPEFVHDAGPHALYEPEARAIVDWMLAHDNIIAVMTYGPNDTLVNVPSDSKMDQSGRIPKGIDKKDTRIYKQVSKAFNDITHMTGAPKPSDMQGSFTSWAYTHQGVYAFETPVWVRPDLAKADDAKDQKDGEADSQNEEAKDAEQESEPEIEIIKIAGMEVEFTQEGIQAAFAEVQAMPEDKRLEAFQALQDLPDDVRQRIRAIVSGQDDPGATTKSESPKKSDDKKSPKKKNGKGDDAKWLAYSDDKREGSGFIPWTSFDHPDFGAVEIGGFVPGFRMNPPSEELERLATEQAAFVRDLVGMFPVIRTDPVSVKKLDQGLWQVSLRIHNDGKLPTRSAKGVKARRLPPMRIEINLPTERVLSGQRRVMVNTIEPGVFQDASWMVLGELGDTITIEVKSAEFGDRALDVVLTDVEEGQ